MQKVFPWHDVIIITLLHTSLAQCDSSKMMMTCMHENVSNGIKHMFLNSSPPSAAYMRQ